MQHASCSTVSQSGSKSFTGVFEPFGNVAESFYMIEVNTAPFRALVAMETYFMKQICIGGSILVDIESSAGSQSGSNVFK